MKKIIISSIIPIFLMGCNSTFIPSGEDKTYNYPIIPSKSFVFTKAPTELNGVTVADVRSETIEQIKKLSTWGRCRPICHNTIHGLTTTNIRGTRYSTNNDEVNVTFVNGANNPRIEGSGSVNTMKGISIPAHHSETKIHSTFKYDITETEKEIILTLNSANISEVKPGRDIINIPYFPLMNEVETKQKLSNIFINFKRPVITKLNSHTVNGEFNVPFDPASVITNFERLATRVNNTSSSTERQYSDSFNIVLDGVVANIDIKVYLYRGNSKIMYRVSYHYEVYDNGQHTSDFGGALKRFEAIVKEIANS